MPAEALITLELDDDIRDEVSRRFCRNVKDAVAGASVRDAILWELEDQLEGRLQPIGDNRQQSGSRLNDPMSVEVHTQLMAMYNQVNRVDPPFQVIANDPKDEDNASAQEAWLAVKFSQYQMDSVLYDLAYNTLRDHCGVLYVGWQQKMGVKREKRFRDREFPDMPSVGEDEQDPEREYDAELVQFQNVESQGCEFRTPDLCDVYLYPSNAQSIKHAVGICERMLLTEDQLVDGIDGNGYDEQEVNRLIRMGPTHTVGPGGDIRKNRDLYDGTSDSIETSADGFYECFLYFGRLPKLRDGDGVPTIPEHYLQDDVMCMICPDRQIVFQMDISPFGDRPYLAFHMIRRPGRFQGKGAMQLVQPLQDESNAFSQLLMDSANLELAPAMIVPAEHFDEYRKFSIYAGAIFPEWEVNTVRPLVWPTKIPGGLEILEHLQTRAQGVISSEGFGVLQNKVRKNEEIRNVLSAAEPKFDLFLAPWNAGKAELGARIVALHMQFEGSGMNDTIKYNGKQVEVTAGQMRGKYRYVPTGSSTTISKEMQLQIAQAKAQTQVAFFQLLANQATAMFAPYLWHGAREVLIALGEREPEQWIGQEPQSQQQPQGVNPALQALQAAGVNPAVIAQQLAASGGPQFGVVSNGTGG